jgi:23S rRNA (adenine1618-N6)-methyltransferase
LARYVRETAYGDASIDFFDPEAVRALNAAILAHHYGVRRWEIPQGYLCPPIPGRADYLHHLADLLASARRGAPPRGSRVRCLDIGVGASCVYPIIGAKEYGWSFVGAEIDPVALAAARRIVAATPYLQKLVELRPQRDSKDTLRGVVGAGELFDATICNPPFHASLAEARAGSVRKLRNLTGSRAARPVLNFGGKNTELWCEGGETGFIRRMIRQSREFSASCCWFTTLVSKQSNLRPIEQELRSAAALDVTTIPVSQGSKAARIVAWTFLSRDARRRWALERWS